MGIPGLAIGVPFALATIVPFGTFRRMLVGIGAAVPMAALTALAVSTAAAAFGATGDDLVLYFVMWVAAAALACSLAFYLAYRIAR